MKNINPHSFTLPFVQSWTTGSPLCLDGVFIMKRKDIIGLKFGRLTVISYSHTNSDNKACYNCVCDCGNEKIASGKSMRFGKTMSCGCLKNELDRTRNLKHGYCVGKKTPEYYIWRSIIERCENKNNKSYKFYGAKGITICDEWRRNFSTFINDMGPKPNGFSIERLDCKSGYSKENCIWADKYQQANNRSSNRLFTFDGKTQTIAQWAKQLNLKSGTIYMRLYRNWDVKKALEL